MARAQDRLFQLDYLRRKGLGRLAEILGSDGLETDLVARTVGLNRIAAAHWDELPDEPRRLTTAFAAGINAHIDVLAYDAWPVEFDLLDYRPEPERATYQGIVRDDGRTATRNYIGVLTSVNCSATVARHVAAKFNDTVLAEFPNVDGVVALTHDYGCGGCAGMGLNYIQRTISGYSRHPNFYAVVIIGLGCEANQIGAMMDALAEPWAQESMTQFEGMRQWVRGTTLQSQVQSHIHI